MRRAFLSCLAIVLWQADVLACTAFSVSDHNQIPYVAKNYDWVPFHGHGLVYINKRNVAKVAQLQSLSQPVQWTSRYGSVTFNQVGAEFPMGGINEAGLVVEILQLGDTEYVSKDDPRPALNESQWIQYQLDNYASVSEIIEHADEIRVEKTFIGVHYFACDVMGECGIFEYLNGRLVITNGSGLGPKVLTNTFYEAAYDYYRKTKEGLPVIADSSSMRSKARFALAATRVDEYDPSLINPLAFSFATLREVEMTRFLLTQWSLVYTPHENKVYFRTRIEPSIKSIHLDGIDFSCRTPRQMLNIHWPDSENVNPHFSDFDYEKNRALIDENWIGLSRELRQQAADYPLQMTHCLEGDPDVQFADLTGH